MSKPNDLLRGAREGIESPHASGDHLSREELADLVNTWLFEHTGSQRAELDSNYIGKLEQGRIRWPQDPNRRAALRAVLGAKTDAELGLRRPRRGRTMVRGVDRQHFLRAGLGASAGALTGSLPLLELLVPTQPPQVPSTVSMHHIAGVRATAEEFEDLDARYGGGLMREAVTAQLRYCAELLNASCPESLRGELLTAVGSFAETAGFMAYDDFAYDDAQRAYQFALTCAEDAGNWHLRAQVLCSMAALVSRCGDPDAGLAYTEAALIRSTRLTATERAMLHNSRGRDLARLGEVQDALRAVGAADEAFSHAHPTEDPPWMASYTDSRHTGFAGDVLREFGMQGQYVAETRNRLTTAIATRPEGRARTRGQIRLASLIMVTGDPREAVALGIQALDWSAPLRSRRATSDFHDLNHLAQPHANIPEVADLRARLRIPLTAA
ncbi:MAG: XRE family transcriptional regulator [Pseudonocardiaceae bacterium]